MSDRPHCHGDVCITCSDEAVQVRVVRLLEADLAVVDTGQSMEEVALHRVRGARGRGRNGDAPVTSGLRRFVGPEGSGEPRRGAPMCTCRACWLLFTHQSAAGGRYRAVPDRYLFDAGFRLGDGAREALQIPVRVAFFFHNSDLGRVAAFYPSPAGATESLLPLEALAEVVAANPVMTDLGLARMHWKGFDGGQEAWEAIDGFFDAVRERSRVP